jgi:hypothetical protein
MIRISWKPASDCRRAVAFIHEEKVAETARRHEALIWLVSPDRQHPENAPRCADDAADSKHGLKRGAGRGRSRVPRLDPGSLGPAGLDVSEAEIKDGCIVQIGTICQGGGDGFQRRRTR